MKTQEINFNSTKAFVNSVWEYFLQNGLSKAISKLQDSSELKCRTSWTGSIGCDTLKVLKSWKSRNMPDFPKLEERKTSSYNLQALWAGRVIKSQDYISHGEVTQDRWTVLFAIK